MVMEAQLRLAGEMGRAVSVHGVQAHGLLFDSIKGLWKGHELTCSRAKRRQNSDWDGETTVTQSAKPRHFPPRICLHSYSGSVENLSQYFMKTVPAEVYVSVSMVVNFTSEHGSEKANEVVRWVPDDRLLIESDLHRAGEGIDDAMEAVGRKVCELKGWGLEEGVTILGRNWRRFVFGREEEVVNEKERSHRHELI